MSVHVHIHLDQAEGAEHSHCSCQVSDESEWHTGRLVRESVWWVDSRQCPSRSVHLCVSLLQKKNI